MIAIIDYGAGNLQSVVKALNYIDCKCEITNDINTILNADGAIMPGVGSFEDAMNSMTACGADKAIKEFVATGKPFLGICLGLQLLFANSEESPNAKGLALLDGTITKIPNDNGKLKIPHMGWNSLDIKKRDGLFKGIEGNPYVYFVHSYFLTATDKSIVSSQTEYGTTIDASVAYKNIMATQFHPEKSGKVGLQILRNFADMANGKEVL
ncbi:MAG: imidazole glycerol phosphate synthase subunit HisH [Acutalibacteraceae bacterium]|nr:imidazole glycerol phosphate synthase subunit HisH [Acutalibacteraceae bacterium]